MAPTVPSGPSQSNLTRRSLGHESGKRRLRPLRLRPLRLTKRARPDAGLDACGLSYSPPSPGRAPSPGRPPSPGPRMKPPASPARPRGRCPPRGSPLPRRSGGTNRKSRISKPAPWRTPSAPRTTPQPRITGPTSSSEDASRRDAGRRSRGSPASLRLGSRDGPNWAGRRKPRWMEPRRSSSRA